MAAGDATWNPKKNVAYRVTFPILDADGDLVTGATGLDPEVSKDGGTFTNATNTVTEIATSSGVYYLDLTATEMNADTVAVIVKTSSSGAKTTVLVMYPLETSDMPVDVLSWNSVAATGMPMPTYTQPSGFLAATFPGGTIASTTNITAGTIANVTNAVTANTTQLAGQTVAAAGAVTFPSTVSSLTASGVRTELSTELGRIDVATSTRLAGSAYTTPPTAAAIADAVWDETIGDHLAGGSTGAALNAAGSAGDPWTTTLPGSYTGSQAGKILADILTDTGTTLQAEVDDIQSRLPAALVSGRMDASVGAMAANVLTASALATDAVTEVAGATADAVWDEAYAGHTVAGSFGKLLDILRKANYITEGSVAAGGTPTTTSFRTNLTEPNDTFNNQTLLFITGALAGESVPILTFANTNGLITTQDALTAAPTAGDEFVVLPDHVHSVGEIADAVLDDAVEGSETLAEAIRLIRSALVGRLAGAATTTVTTRDAANTKNRITATVTADGNRTDVTTDAT
jgi:hypothetical protein